MPFEASQALFRSLSSQKESKLSKTLFTSRALGWLAFFFGGGGGGHLLGFLSVGKGIAKSPRIVKFFGRKYEWVVRQNFHWNFLVKVTVFFAFFSGLFE